MLKHGDTMGADITVCMEEAADYDCVFRLKTIFRVDPNECFKHGIEEVAYKLVQLKRIPSHALNPATDVQSELHKLAKYGVSSDLLVGILVDRDENVDLRQLDFSRLGVEQVWLLGGTASGEVIFHGGLVEDWKSGVCWQRVRKGGRIESKPLRFRPK